MKRTRLPKAKVVKYWVNHIDTMLDNRKYRFAWDTLKDIKSTIIKYQDVSQGQVRAIKNIQFGKNSITND